MFAPMIIEVAWARVITPALTKPTTMTVVADELWITIVTPVPTAMPANLLLLILLNTDLSRLPATDSRFSLIILRAIRKTPSPPNRVKIVSKTSIILCTDKPARLYKAAAKRGRGKVFPHLSPLPYITKTDVKVKQKYRQKSNFIV